MIEILNIIYIIFFSTVLFSLKLTDPLIFKLKLAKLSILEKFSINLLIFFLIFLFISFLEINYKILTYCFFLISLFAILYNFKNNLIFQSNNIIKLITFFILSFILSFDIITNPKLEWDGHYWYFHALNFYENHNFFNLEKTSFKHYPHLGGFLWSFFWNISFLNYEFFGRIGYVIVYIISILSISENISKNIFIKLVFCLVLIFSTYDKFLFGGYQAYLIFSIILILCNLINKLKSNDLDLFQITFIIISSNLLMWIKNEGLFYYLFFLAYLFFYSNFKKKIYVVLLGLFLILIKFFLVSQISEINSFNINQSSFVFDDVFFQKIKLILIHIIIASFKYPVWLIFFLCLLIKKIEKENFYIIIFLLFSLFLILLVFLLTGPENTEWYVTGALDRIMLHLSGFLIIFISSRVKYLIKSFA